MKNIIYGAAAQGELFCREIEKQRGEVSFFIDQYTEKASLLDKPIKRLEEVCLTDANIYVSMTTPKAEVKVLEKLKERGAANVLSFLDTLHQFPGLMEKSIGRMDTWYSPAKEEMIDHCALARVRGLLRDEKSRKLLDTVMRFREEPIPENHPAPDFDPQYFPSDIDLFRHTDRIRFVDGGAYTGDTLSVSLHEFCKRKKEVEYIASFEPDPSNQDRLALEVEKRKQTNPGTKFLLYPFGLWSSNGRLQFCSNGNSSSSIIDQTDVSENGATFIDVVSLDRMLGEAAPNYIKLDIEGAEKEAISGAKNILSEYAPALAICLYHKPCDLWELPLLINEIQPNYDMHLRVYGNLGMELVLYCVERPLR